MSRILENRENQITLKYGNGHVGIDVIGTGRGIPNVVAHSDGIVAAVEKNYTTTDKSGSSYGNYVKIKHNNSYYTLYAHLDVNSVKVNVNDKVKKGQIIGTMGNTGYSLGTHLHFEVRDQNDKRIDPTKYINADLPSVTTSDIVYTVKKGDTLSAIARQYNTTYQKLAEYNHISNPNIINVGQTIKIPKNTIESVVYTVKSGDTLSSIARKYNTTWQAIYEKNKSIIGNDPNLIRVGQKFTIKN